jgi:multidrug efflux pump subunit AcrA (membrane-fusion protein)
MASEDRRQRTLNSGNVWLVRDNQLGRRVFVRTGIADSSRVELVSGDLRNGDELAVAAIAPRTGRRGFF